MYRPPLERFSERWSASESGCWLWNRRTVLGYGRVMWDDGSVSQAHRAAYLMLKGPIPSGLLVRHTCDTKACVNPDHLILGTHSDNSRDAVSRGQIPSGEKWHLVNRNLPRGESHPGAKLTDAQVKEIRESSLSSYRLAKNYGVSATHIRRLRRGQYRNG